MLKLICLQSNASNGLRSRLLEQYKREILHGYGYQHLNTLIQLEKAGLVKTQEEKGGLLRAQDTKGFPAIRKQLQLVAHGDDVDDKVLITRLLLDFDWLIIISIRILILRS